MTNNLQNSKAQKECLSIFGDTRKPQIELLGKLLGELKCNRDETIADSVPIIQILGNPGTGKTSLVHTYLTSIDVPYVYVDCALTAIDPNEWGGSGALRDIVLTPTLWGLYDALQRDASKLGKRITKDLPIRISTHENFIKEIVNLLTTWVEICYSMTSNNVTFKEKTDCKSNSVCLPTPVFVFDNAPALLHHYESFLSQLMRLPIELYKIGRNIIINKDTHLPHVILILIGQRPLMTTDLIPPPIVWLPPYSSECVQILESQFNSLAVPVIQHMKKINHLNNNNAEDFKETLFEGENHEKKCKENILISQKECNYDETFVRAQVISLTESKKDFLIENEDNTDVIKWIAFNNNDCFIYPKGCSMNEPPSLDSLDISYNVLSHLWIRFIFVLSLGLLRRPSSDFHDTLLIVKRLWAIYILPVLQLRPWVKNLLQLRQFERLLEELRTHLERHFLFRTITSSTHIHHLRIPAMSSEPLQSIFPKVIQNYGNKQNSCVTVHVPSNRFEAPSVLLLLLVAEFVASYGTTAGIRNLIEGRRRRLNQAGGDQIMPELPKSFSLQQWMMLSKFFFKIVGLEESTSFLTLRQLTTLMETKFTFSAGVHDATGRLNGVCRYVCLATLETVNDIAKRIELPLTDYLSAVLV